MRTIFFATLVLLLVWFQVTVGVKAEAQETVLVLPAEAITITLFPIRGELPKREKALTKSII